MIVLVVKCSVGRSSDSSESKVTITILLTAFKQKGITLLSEQIGCSLHYTLKPLKSLHWHNIYGENSFVSFCLQFMPEISEL